MKIEAVGGNDDFMIRRLTANELDQLKSGTPKKESQRDRKLPPLSDRRTFSQFFYSPLTAAWLLAIAGMTFLAVLMLPPKYRFARSRTGSGQIQAVTSAEIVPPIEPLTQALETTVFEQPTVVDPMDARHENPFEDSKAVSALEPANVVVPLAGPPVTDRMVAVDEQPNPLPSAPIKIDIPAKMAQKFAKYQQPKVRRRDLIEALQEQLGASIRYDPQELGLESLDGTTAFELLDTTLGEVINAVAEGAGWQIEIEDSAIRLKRKTP